MTVLAGLPVELWDLVVHHCADADIPRLSAACVALRIYARARLERRWAATRNSVDVFVSTWQAETARCDRWRLHCALCPYGTFWPRTGLLPIFFSLLFSLRVRVV